ncbi:hypothetical protein AMJ49_03050 [Parcubacteria bacterium DG_74_2]|nr:MAG: hypothetical protein AMJ49_03050 [Parcubacteria bacterium DG_74_2]
MEKFKFQRLKKLLPGLKRNILLKNYTTFRIGGKAKFLFVAQNKEDLIKKTSTAKKIKLPFFILGGGSNVLISDKGYNGLVIKTLNKRYKVESNKIYAEAGTPLGKLVDSAAKTGLAGLEWAVGIPGTIGGAIFGNAGAFGKSIRGMVKEVEVFDAIEEKIRVFPKNKCCFGYRKSIFKKKKNLIILSVVLMLKKGKKTEISNKMKENLEHKIRTQPLNSPSVGCVFKNPKGFFAAELIEKCGLKGKKIGGIKVSEKHANFILNFKKGKANDVKKLMKLIKQKVKKQFGILLEEEIQFLPLDKHS